MSKTLVDIISSIARLLPMRAKLALYRWPPLARLIRGGLNYIVPGGLSEVTVAAGGLAGMRLRLYLRSEKDYWLGTYEPELQAAIKELVPPGCICYDLGANIGYISLLMARCAGPNGHVFAFEALPANLERLRQNIALNGMEDRITPIHAAVTNSSAPVRFLIGPSDDTGKAEGSAGRRQLAYHQTITVPGICLDDHVYLQGHPQPGLIKIDIEGGEVLAIPGMQRILSQARPIVLLELHGPEAAQVAWEALLSANYQLYWMRAGFPPLTSITLLDWKAYLVGMPMLA